MRRRSRRKHSNKSYLSRYIMKRLKRYKIIKSVKVTDELYLLGFFVFLFVIIVSRLFYLQVVRAKHYEDLL